MTSPMIDTFLALGHYAVYLIAGLFILATVIVAINTVRTAKEKHYLKTAIAKFEQAKAEKCTTEQTVQLIAGNLPDCIVRKRVNLLYKIRQMPSISGDLLSRLDQLEENDSYRFVRFVASILLILGLLGTVIGLTIAIRGLSPAITNAEKAGNLAELTGAMTKTMGGLETAFAATLVALATTFLLAIIVVLAQRYEASFHHMLESFLTYDLIPKILISTELEASTLYVEAIEKSASDISNAANTLERSRAGIQIIVDGLIQATKTSENRIVDFFNFAQSFKDSVSQMIGYNDDLKQVYKNIQDIFREMQENQVTHKIIGEIVDKSVARALTEANESVALIRQSFKNDITEIMKSQQKYVEAVDKTTEAITKFSQENADSLARVVTSSFETVLRDFKQGLQQAREREDVSRMVAGEALEQFRSYVQEAAQTQDRSHTTVASLHARTGEALDQFRLYVQEALKNQQQHRTALDELRTQAGDFHRQLLNRLNNGQAGITHILGEKEQASDRHKARGE